MSDQCNEGIMQKQASTSSAKKKKPFCRSTSMPTNIPLQVLWARHQYLPLVMQVPDIFGSGHFREIWLTVFPETVLVILVMIHRKEAE